MSHSSYIVLAGSCQRHSHSLLDIGLKGFGRDVVRHRKIDLPAACISTANLFPVKCQQSMPTFNDGTRQVNVGFAHKLTD
jgi:hypothetical protein